MKIIYAKILARFPITPALPIPTSLDSLQRGQSATVAHVVATHEGDSIATRLGHLGFVPGETVELRSYGPFGREPLLIQVGMTRFALRRAEAQRVRVYLKDNA